MIDELQTASNLLGVALDRYLAACSAIAACYNPVDTLDSISRVISDLIPHQLDLITAYSTKFKQAKTTITQIRNTSPAIVPVNSLPPDIMNYIFHLVRNDSEERNDFSPYGRPRYPETLTHVCSHWRHIAIGSRPLWSRIDLPLQPDTPSSCRVLARAEVFAARSDPSPVYMHFIEMDRRIQEYDALNVFCASVATRIRSLKLSCHIVREHHRSVLQSCFSNCTPGALHEISLTGYGNIPTFTCSSGQLPDVSGGWLEDVLLPVRVLRLAGTYFDWTSQAYHGLVELRLFPRKKFEGGITQMEFIGIVSGSPGLRVLHFGLEITDPLPHEVVKLNDLEDLNLHCMCWEDVEIVLRLLSPGSKSLKLSVTIPHTAHKLSRDELTSFMDRSNIEEFYLESEEPERALSFHEAQEPLSLFELCGLLPTPHLRKLSLTQFKFKSESNIASPSQSLNHAPHCIAFSHLDALKLDTCVVDVDDLRRVAEVVRIQKLELAGASVPRADELNVPVIESTMEPRYIRYRDPWDNW